MMKIKRMGAVVLERAGGKDKGERICLIVMRGRNNSGAALTFGSYWFRHFFLELSETRWDEMCALDVLLDR